MKNLLSILVVVAVLIAGYFVVYKNGSTSPATDKTEPLTTQSRWPAKTDNQGSVTVRITPIRITESQNWEFEVVIDTHSVELDQDMIQASVLINNEKNVYKPLAWNGSEPGGHHRNGILVFEPIASSDLFEIRIMNVGDVAERSFVWSADDGPAEDISTIDNINQLELYEANGSKYDMSKFADKNVVLFFNEGLMCYPSCWRQIAFFGADPRFQAEDVVAVAVVVDDPQDWQRQAITKMPDLSKTLTLFDVSRNASQSLGLLNVESSMHKGQYPGHSYVLADKSGIIREIIDDPKMGINNDSIMEKLGKF